MAVLPDDMTYFINTRLFDVVTVPRTHVPLGTVGLVTAVAGRVRPTDRPFARHVQCDDFQDGDAFLVNGGEQGRQLSVVLAGGTSYAINPLLFKVTTVNNLEDSGDGLTSDDLREVAVPIGYAGVVVTLDGDIPNRSDGDMIGPIIPGHRSFQLPWVFLEQGGVRGVQEEVLSEGETYALNPWFVRVVLVPTRYLILEWRTSENWESLNHDAHLDEITFSVQGHRLRLPLTQTLRIPASAAPRLVSAFGSPSGLGGVISYRVTMQRFADRVLGTTVANFLHGLAATSTVDDLIGRYHQIKVELSDQIRASLDEWGVVALETVMGPFEVEDPRLNETLRRIVETRTTETTKSQLLMHENQIDEMRVRAERRRAALELEREVELLGYDNVEMRRIIGKISKMQVPMAVSADISGLLDYLPMTIASSLLRQLRELRTAQGKKTEGSPENPSQL
ncbi:SPFH domain-containing protein [Streptosporangium sp. NPDC051023]|uniref:SPFH domain-containing protein n=1 Tax=Streptosporangium sp. NPDC051023 TaxID=3155410 RepID=UPI00344E8089